MIFPLSPLRPCDSFDLPSICVRCKMFLFAKGSNLRITIPSRSIDDIRLPEDSYKPDFELSKRYQDFAKEIVRFALLGITGYGFLIEKVIGPEHMADMAGGISLTFTLIGLCCLVSSAGLGLYCGQLNKACLLMQVSILRLLQRRHADRWINPELSSPAEVEKWTAANEQNLATLREGQAESQIGR